MNVGEYIETPRFSRVKITEYFETESEAHKAGYTEPTHYRWQHQDGHDVLGKVIATNRMVFALVKLD